MIMKLPADFAMNKGFVKGNTFRQELAAQIRDKTAQRVSPLFESQQRLLQAEKEKITKTDYRS
jgi:hypothetical protein